MKAPQTLKRPANWQDFETLCKKLWGEIWQCPEIKKNGRSGQEQHGIDIYGIPFGETNYYGIQCRGKNEYSNHQFTENEILNEIKTVKDFRPSLKKLYLATTAVKDAKIEAFIRIKNLEHTQKGLFEIHLFSWEDIVDLIYENRQTYQFYVNSQDYKTNNNVDVTFENGETNLLVHPKFKQSLTNFKLANSPNVIWSDATELYKFPNVPRFYITTNLSYFKFRIKILNTGSEALEEWKLLTKYEGDIYDISDTNEHCVAPAVYGKLPYQSIHINLSKSSIEIMPKKKILVGDDTFMSEDIYIKTSPTISTITIKWKLISKNFKTEGTLYIFVDPIIQQTLFSIPVNSLKDERDEKGEILELIEGK